MLELPPEVLDGIELWAIGWKIVKNQTSLGPALDVLGYGSACMWSGVAQHKHGRLPNAPYKVINRGDNRTSTHRRALDIGANLTFASLET